MDYKPTSQGVEFNISLNRHVSLRVIGCPYLFGISRPSTLKIAES